MTSQQTPRRRGRGPTDPDRRDRIARAAIEIVAAHGIDGLTHRKVAAAAGVPLGSTTYHFATLAELTAAALDTAARSSVAQLRDWEQALPQGADLAAALADFAAEAVSRKRRATLAEYHLYGLALQRPHLRGAAVAWDDAMAQVLAKRTDTVTGHMLGAMLCGLLMQAVLREEATPKSHMEALLRRALT